MVIILFLIGIFLVSMGVIGWLFFEFRKEAVLAAKAALVASDVAKMTAMLKVKEEELRQLQLQLKESNDRSTANEERITRLKASGVDESVVAHLRAENAAFKDQLDLVSRQFKVFQEDVSRQELERGRARIESENLIDQLRGEIAQLKLAPVAHQAEESGLKNRIEDLSSRVQEFEMTIASELEKNEYLQYELTKSRAQVLGLERLCGAVSTSVVS